MKTLVLDAETRTALAVVRALGGADLQAYTKAPLAGASRYCRRLLSSPSPTEYPKDFQDWLIQTLREDKYDLLLPLTDCSLELVLEREAEVRANCKLPFVPYETFRKINNKADLLELAKLHRLNIPETLKVTLDSDLSSFPFPAVLKPVSARTRVESTFVRAPVCYPNSADEVKTLLEKHYKGVPALLQQKILGVGVGIFVLCKNGEALTTFAHQRILEKPPSGGVSVLSKSIPLDNLPLGPALELMRSLNWEGVAMLEFKQDERGDCYLMEINPRFWGSLQLAIDSGRNFPKLLCKGSSEELPPYLEGQNLRSELGCLDHAIIRLKNNFVSSLLDLTLRNSLKLWHSKIRVEVFRFDDPKPFFRQLFLWVGGK